MSLVRDKYGIEYTQRPKDRDSSGLGWVFVLVAIVALGSLAWTLFSRYRNAASEAEPPKEAVQPPPVDGAALMPPPAQGIVTHEAPTPVPPPPEAEPPKAPTEEEQAAASALQEKVSADDISRRPVKVRNLLMRLEEAVKAHDVEMAVGTIEAIRALPGSPAADLDDSLARQLGALNLRRLFERRNAQWVKTVEVKRGDSASRIAAENGSTLASFARLNGGDIDRIRIGQKVYVMNHPRFNLVIHRRARTADLSLNGKFFRRYDLADEVRGKEGAYAMPEKKRSLWNTIGVRLDTEDRNEIEMLLPVGASVLVSEM